MLSDKDKANLPTPTAPGFSAWRTAAQQRLDRPAHTPGTSLGGLEIAVVEDLRRLGASWLTQAANVQGRATPFLCSRCRGPLVREARNQVRKIDSVVGALHLGRDYGWCQKCQDWSHPADVRWGLQPNAPASPRVQEMAAEAVLKRPCAQAEKSLPRLGGCSLSSTTLHREASRQGQRALALQKADQHRATTVQGVVELAKEIGYFTTHAHRMNYASGRRKQQPLGSGAIESACRQYQVRFKRSGQFWSLAGDEALLALETLRRNERWLLMFPHASRQPAVATQARG